MKTSIMLGVVLLASSVVAQDLPPVPDVVQENASDDQYPGGTHVIYGWAGEPKNTYPTRDNRAGEYEVHADTQTVWRGQPFVPPLNVASQDDLVITCRDGEADIIVIKVLIDGKPDIVEQHVGGDGKINWDGVAGENDAAHDHWPNGFGILTIENFDSADDRVIVTGHTVTYGGTFTGARWNEIAAQGEGGEGRNQKLTDDLEQYGYVDPSALVTRVYSQQGAGGGAHDEDTLGWIEFPGLEEVRQPEFIGTNVGVCETIGEFNQLVDYYQAVEDAQTPDNPDPDDFDLEFILWLAQFGMTPDDFTEEQLQWLLEWFQATN